MAAWERVSLIRLKPTVAAGDRSSLRCQMVDKSETGPSVADELPAGVVRDYPLARLTTIRTGGNAELFARPGTIAELERLLSWAAAAKLQVGVVGSGSNLLVADVGVRGLVLKLDRQLSQIEQDGDHLECGGGARLPAVSAAAPRRGLSGMVFGVNIPGTTA